MCPEVTISNSDIKTVTTSAIKVPKLKYCPTCGLPISTEPQTFTNKNGSTFSAIMCLKCKWIDKSTITVSNPTS